MQHNVCIHQREMMVKLTKLLGFQGYWSTLQLHKGRDPMCESYVTLKVRVELKL